MKNGSTGRRILFAAVHAPDAIRIHPLQSSRSQLMIQIRKEEIFHTNNSDNLSDYLEPIVTKFRQFKFEFGGNLDAEWDQFDTLPNI